MRSITMRSILVRDATRLASALVVLLVGCGRGDAPPASGDTTKAAAADTASAPPAPTRPGELSPERRAALERAANQVVSFLSGKAKFDDLALADTVQLLLPAEGAGKSTGTSVRLARSALRAPEAWNIRAGRQSFSFVPPERLTTVTTRAGTHFNCQEVPLASRAPALATRPHVGVRFEPREPTSCLETWNATFVFDTSTATPRLVAALYDQWEW
jgi:hypothetical protein